MTAYVSAEEAADAAYLERELPEVELEKGVKNCGGRIADYLKVLEITHRYGKKQRDELEAVWREKDYENYTLRVHAMKSSTLNIGAVRISEMARQLELAGKQGDYAYIDANTEAFQSAYGALIGHIGQIMLHYFPEEETAEAEKEELDETFMRHALARIRQCIEEFDFAKVFSMLEELRDYRLPEKYKEPVAQISAWMEDLSVDEICGLIDELLS